MRDAKLRYGKKPKEKYVLYTLMNGEYTFHPGIDVEQRGGSRTNRRQRTQAIRTADISSNVRSEPLIFLCNDERRKLPPASGKIRILESSNKYPKSIASFWNRDMTLTEWIGEFTAIKKQYEENTISSVLYPSNYLEVLHDMFITNQRKRFLVRKMYRKWSQRVWMKRTQCNITLIDMEPIAEKDAIYLTSTKHHQIFRFHRNDVFTNFLTNIGSCDEMLPTPRTPTNPWTNEPLTFQQTLSICHQMISWYAGKGKCPPLIFSAFCASRYNIRTFRYKHSSLLAHHAIQTYFAEITSDNHDVILDTIAQLLTAAGCIHSYVCLSRWLKAANTPLHKEWLSVVCDYTLYMNLHIQVRPYWYSQSYILFDVRRLYDRSYAFRDIVRPRTSTQPSTHSNPSTPSNPSNPSTLSILAAFENTPGNAITNTNANAITNANASAYPGTNTPTPPLSVEVQFYNANQLLGVMLASELEGTLTELIHQAQIIIDEQQMNEDQDSENENTVINNE